MQKGFTLIELLVVMIIVSLLVVVSVPKYKTAMEKARAQEGITNLTLAADQANGYYMMQEGSYAGVDKFLEKGMDGTKINYFQAPTVGVRNNIVTITVKSGKGYSLFVKLGNGRVTDRGCTPDADNATAARLCDAIGWGS